MKGAHAQTILPALYRKIEPGVYHTFVIRTPDNDLLWADYYPAESKKIAILSHGLEGSSQRHYIQSLAKQLQLENWAVVAWNYRSCGPEMNRTLRFYHSGDTEDLQTVLDYLKESYPQYQEYVLAGFSLGGNITLKYLGERGDTLSPLIKAGVSISVPIDLASGSKGLESGMNKIYTMRFLQHLSSKIRTKAKYFPELEVHKLRQVRTLRDFDDLFTAPLHGFRDAADYYRKASAKHYLEGIRVPTLILQAKDDPMLPTDCYPTYFAKDSSYVHLQCSSGGGHVGFVTKDGLHAPSFADSFVVQWLRRFS
jgi:hypothetical protein